MTPRSTVILSTLAGFIAGAALVGGLAFQPERPPERNQPERGEGDRPDNGPPEDRPRQPGGKGRPFAMDPERLTRRLEEFAKRLDSERELVGKVLAGLKEGKKPGELEPQVREALMLANGRGFNQPPEGGDRPPRQPQEERQELAKVIREADPALADRMEEFQKKRPLGGRILQNVAPKPGDVLRARAENPELFEIYTKQIACGLDVADRAFELGDLLRAGQADAVKAKRAELREAVGRSIDIRAKLQERDLEALEKRVNDLRARVQAAAADREKNIDAFVNMVNRVLDELKRRGAKGDNPPPGDAPPEGRRPKDGPRPNGPPPGNPPPNDRPR